MQTETLTKFRWFSAWNDDKEEAWLGKMAAEGWHLVTVTFPGFYTFRRGQPANMIYRLDYAQNTKDLDNYMQLFRDAGWEHVLAYGGWHYFRILPQPGDAPEIYTDNSSKIQKYQRVMLALLPFLPIYIVLINPLNRQEEPFFQVLTFIFFLMEVLFIYAIVRLFWRINQLKKKG